MVLRLDWSLQVESSTAVFPSDILASGREESLKATYSGVMGYGGGRVRVQYKRVREDGPGSAPALSARGLHQIEEGLLIACPKASSTHIAHPPTTLALKGQEIQEASPLHPGLSKASCSGAYPYPGKESN